MGRVDLDQLLKYVSGDALIGGQTRRLGKAKIALWMRPE